MLLKVLALELPVAFTAVLRYKKKSAYAGSSCDLPYQPDIALVLDAHPAQDFPGVDAPKRLCSAPDRCSMQVIIWVWMLRSPLVGTCRRHSRHSGAVAG